MRPTEYDQGNMIEAFGNVYAECDDEWHPYGKPLEKGNFIIYDNDRNNIFINVPDVLFSEGVVYHKTDDNYPSVSQSESIECIVLDDGVTKFEVDTQYIHELSQILSFSDLATDKIQNIDFSKEFYFINVFYYDYPAYQNEWMVCTLEDGGIGVAFCKPEKNNQVLGENKALIIDSTELAKHIKSITN